MGLFWDDQLEDKTRYVPIVSDELPHDFEQIKLQANSVRSKAFRFVNRHLLYDIEIYKNYFLIAFEDYATGDQLVFESIYNDNYHMVDDLIDVVTNNTLLGFNNLNFDSVLLNLAINFKTVAELKKASDMIIVDKLQGYDVCKHFKIQSIPFRQVDIKEVAFGNSSLKTYAGRLHADKMQDLPYEPSKKLTEEEKDCVLVYCLNDIANTRLLFEHLKPQLALRSKMSVRYKVDLRSKSDAQIAEAVIKAEYLRITGKFAKPPPEQERVLVYTAPGCVSFRTPKLKKLLKDIQFYPFQLVKEKLKFPSQISQEVVINRMAYKMGAGGLHSTEDHALHRSDENFTLVDRDVASYYPQLILNLKLFPSHLGEVFLTIYSEIVKERLAAKKNRDTETADTLKIVVNGSFGKFLTSFLSLLCK